MEDIHVDVPSRSQDVATAEDHIGAKEHLGELTCPNSRRVQEISSDYLHEKQTKDK